MSARTGHRFPRPGRHRIPPLALYATALIAVGVIGSHSRGGFLAMAIAASALVLVFRRESLRIWIGMAFILVIAALLLFAVGSTSPLERLSTIWQTSLTGFNGRSQIWTAGLQAWLANPVWGVGLGCFPEGAAPFYQFEREALYFHAENDYLEVLAEGGLLGFGLGVLAFASIARFASRAYAYAPTTADRTVVMGGVFGLLALAVKSTADFPLHIPGVAVTGLVICAYLCRIGLDSRQNESAADTRSERATGIRVPMAMTAMTVLCVPLLWLSFRQTRNELALLRANIPLPGTQWLTTDYGRLPIGEIEMIESTLEKILQDRPDWTDGHLRLGMMYLSQYEQTTMEWAVAAGQNPSTALIVVEPLWLHGLIHSEAKSEAEINNLIEEDPIWLYLIPAARSFLEARRCCPRRSLSHAWLASLDFLIKEGETTSAHVRRALRQSGNDTRVMALGARAAVQVGDVELASLCWRKSLEINPSTADDIAPLASAVLTPEQILDRVLPVNGTLVIRFADLLYQGPASKRARNLFLQEAIKRNDRDPLLTPSERLWCTAQAWARLEQPDVARKQMEAALAVDPKREPWRNEYVDWLIRWGDTEEAFNQATIGVHLLPSQQGPQSTLDRAAEARSRRRLETKAQL